MKLRTNTIYVYITANTVCYCTCLFIIRTGNFVIQSTAKKKLVKNISSTPYSNHVSVYIAKTPPSHLTEHKLVSLHFLLIKFFSKYINKRKTSLSRSGLKYKKKASLISLSVRTLHIPAPQMTSTQYIYVYRRQSGAD